MPAYLVVRAVVANAGDRAGFDRWYRDEHLPDALKAFNAQSAMRGWSIVEPAMHTAYYRFESVEAVQAVSNGVAIQELIAEFDRVWDTRVTRTRDIINIEDELKG